MLAQGARLEPNPLDRNGKFGEVTRDLLDLARQVSLTQNRALAIDNTTAQARSDTSKHTASSM